MESEKIMNSTQHAQSTDQDRSYKQAMCDATHSAQETVADNPVAATLTTFAIGLAGGVCIGLLLGSESRSSSMTDRIGDRVVNSLNRAVPDFVRRS